MATSDDFWNAAQAAYETQKTQAQVQALTQAQAALASFLTQFAGAPCQLTGANLVLDFRATPLLVQAQPGGAWDLSSSTASTQRLSAQATAADLYHACLALTLHS
jgi:hypothetical protein